ncbi:unnamed protein product [Gordionus sp. m RMFG-2023]
MNVDMEHYLRTQFFPSYKENNDFDSNLNNYSKDFCSSPIIANSVDGNVTTIGNAYVIGNIKSGIIANKHELVNSISDIFKLSLDRNDNPNAFNLFFTFIDSGTTVIYPSFSSELSKIEHCEFENFRQRYFPPLISTINELTVKYSVFLIDILPIYTLVNNSNFLDILEIINILIDFHGGQDKLAILIYDSSSQSIIEYSQFIGLYNEFFYQSQCSNDWDISLIHQNRSESNLRIQYPLNEISKKNLKRFVSYTLFNILLGYNATKPISKEKYLDNDLHRLLNEAYQILLHAMNNDIETPFVGDAYIHYITSRKVFSPIQTTRMLKILSKWKRIKSLVKINTIAVSLDNNLAKNGEYKDILNEKSDFKLENGYTPYSLFLQRLTERIKSDGGKLRQYGYQSTTAIFQPNGHFLNLNPSSISRNAFDLRKLSLLKMIQTQNIEQIQSVSMSFSINSLDTTKQFHHKNNYSHTNLIAFSIASFSHLNNMAFNNSSIEFSNREAWIGVMGVSINFEKSAFCQYIVSARGLEELTLYRGNQIFLIDVEKIFILHPLIICSDKKRFFDLGPLNLSSFFDVATIPFLLIKMKKYDTGHLNLSKDNFSKNLQKYKCPIVFTWEKISSSPFVLSSLILKCNDDDNLKVTCLNGTNRINNFEINDTYLKYLLPTKDDHTFFEKCRPIDHTDIKNQTFEHLINLASHQIDAFLSHVYYNNKTYESNNKIKLTPTHIRNLDSYILHSHVTFLVPGVREHRIWHPLDISLILKSIDSPRIRIKEPEYKFEYSRINKMNTSLINHVIKISYKPANNIGLKVEIAISERFLYKLLLVTFPACRCSLIEEREDESCVEFYSHDVSDNFDKVRCLIIDSFGYVLTSSYFSSFNIDSRSNPIVGEHIIRAEPRFFVDLVSATPGFRPAVTSTSCLINKGSSEILRFGYAFATTSIIEDELRNFIDFKTSFDNKKCKEPFVLLPIDRTNLFVVVISRPRELNSSRHDKIQKSEPDYGLGGQCPVFCPCSRYQNTCFDCGLRLEKETKKYINEKSEDLLNSIEATTDCECPCECEVKDATEFYIANQYDKETFLRSSYLTTRGCLMEKLYSTIPNCPADEYIINNDFCQHSEYLKIVTSQNCQILGSNYLNCLGLIGCEWCTHFYEKQNMTYNIIPFKNPSCFASMNCTGGIKNLPGNFSFHSLGNKYEKLNRHREDLLFANSNRFYNYRNDEGGDFDDSKINSKVPYFRMISLAPSDVPYKIKSISNDKTPLPAILGGIAGCLGCFVLVLYLYLQGPKRSSTILSTRHNIRRRDEDLINDQDQDCSNECQTSFQDSFCQGLDSHDTLLHVVTDHGDQDMTVTNNNQLPSTSSCRRKIGSDHGYSTMTTKDDSEIATNSETMFSGSDASTVFKKYKLSDILSRNNTVQMNTFKDKNIHLAQTQRYYSKASIPHEKQHPKILIKRGNFLYNRHQNWRSKPVTHFKNDLTNVEDEPNINFDKTKHILNCGRIIYKQNLLKDLRITGKTPLYNDIEEEIFVDDEEYIRDKSKRSPYKENCEIIVSPISAREIKVPVVFHRNFEGL